MNKKVLIDKQALINKLTKYVERYEGATDEYYQGKRSAYEIALKSAKKLGLDEPQKPVVPKFVAEWIEQAKKERQSLYEAMYNIESSTYYHKYDNATYQWMFERVLHDEQSRIICRGVYARLRGRERAVVYSYN